MTFSVGAGEVGVVLGLNGAGKSTTVKVRRRRSAAAGRRSIPTTASDVTDWSTARCVAAGIVLVPEGRHVFPDLTVDANLDVGAWTQRRDTFVGGVAAGARSSSTCPGCGSGARSWPGTLSGGEQQMLAMGRGMMARPRLLMVDEASLGLAPAIVKEILPHRAASWPPTGRGRVILRRAERSGALPSTCAARRRLASVQQGRIVAEPLPQGAPSCRDTRPESRGRSTSAT